MGIDRRAFVCALGASLALGADDVLAGSVPRSSYLSAAKADGTHSAVLFDAEGELHWSVQLPARGHGGAFRPRAGECIMFARRPGTFAVVLDRRTGELKHTIAPPDGRSFYGHGCYSADGRVLYTTENDYDGERGVIGLWDAAKGYQRLGEFDSHGIGPHEVILLPDGHTLAIANGGILTHPETGRQKLNIPDMAPSLVLVDSRDGTLRAEHAPPRELHKVSLRHLSANQHGQLFAAAQFEGVPEEAPPLLASLGADGLQFHAAPAAVQKSMKNYCGAVSFDATGRHIAVSCPRGNLITIWSQDGTYRSSVRLIDGCGVAPLSADGAFLASSGTGKMIKHAAQATERVNRPRSAQVQWDNHIAAHAFLE
ncbi:MAG: DUF1513 domain-containing protein [Pseudomonadota bacterium]